MEEGEGRPAIQFPGSPQGVLLPAKRSTSFYQIDATLAEPWRQDSRRAASIDSLPEVVSGLQDDDLIPLGETPNVKKSVEEEM